MHFKLFYDIETLERKGGIIMIDNIVYFLGGIAIGTLMAYIAEAIDNYREEKNKHEKNN